MDRKQTLAGLVLGALGMFAGGFSCNNKIPNKFDAPQTQIGPLTVRYASTIQPVHRQFADNALQSQYTTFSYMFGPQGNVRDVFIHDLNMFPYTPYGVVSHNDGYAQNNEIHLTIGSCAEVPAAYHALVHSYIEQNIWHQQPNTQFWDGVAMMQSSINLAIRQNRRCP